MATVGLTPTIVGRAVLALECVIAAGGFTEADNTTRESVERTRLALIRLWGLLHEVP